MESPIFILSTGRTGTQFFEDYINQTTDLAICRHEPKPSRRFKFLSNLYLDNKVSDKLVANVYQFSRKSLFKEIGDKTYIESNNFIFGCIPALNRYYESIRIIHIVRHPVDYVVSHLNHGFWKGHKKFFTKYVPYWIEEINTKNRSNPLQVLSSRWNYVNQQIGDYERSNSYLRIKFEEIFSNEAVKASQKLNEIRDFCEMDNLDERENLGWLNRPKNYSRNNHELTNSEREYVTRNCNPLMKMYSYDE